MFEVTGSSKPSDNQGSGESASGPTVDSANFGEDLNELLDRGVLNSEAFILLLTRRTLHRPWTLIEAYEAIRAKRPFVTVAIEGGGYDFRAAANFLTTLATSLDRVNDGSYNELRSLCQARRRSPLRSHPTLHIRSTGPSPRPSPSSSSSSSPSPFVSPHTPHTSQAQLWRPSVLS